MIILLICIYLVGVIISVVMCSFLFNDDEIHNIKYVIIWPLILIIYPVIGCCGPWYLLGRNLRGCLKINNIDEDSESDVVTI